MGEFEYASETVEAKVTPLEAFARLRTFTPERACFLFQSHDPDSPEGRYSIVGYRIRRREMVSPHQSVVSLLNELEGFQLRLHDWKGEWRCGKLEPEQLEEYLGHYTPGEHSLSVERRWPAPPGAREAALGDEVPEVLVEETLRLIPLFRYAVWSKESDFLFAGA